MRGRPGHIKLKPRILKERIMTKGLSEFKFLMDIADSSALMKSCKHCHAKNVSSIVVKDVAGVLTRVFLAWPGHELHENELYDGYLPVGIHDHKYNLKLKRITGRVQHIEYKIGSHGPMLKHWTFASGQTTNPPVVQPKGLYNIDEMCRRDLDDYSTPLHYQRLHNIVCKGPAAWLVRESEPRQMTTNLYTKADLLNFDGLYSPFKSEDQVRNHVTLFLDLVKNKGN
ncbi:MAG: hypothetical protein COA78_24850 [Blastopirellula sp.]|nr:MAG: hypothetical protein COA78_24850 [Blastopirellula sp.]